MSRVVDFAVAGRLPRPGDNVAIATFRLEAGTVVRLPAGETPLSHTILEGHRFAVVDIPAGAPLLSWGLPFGVARRPIRAGEYVINPGMLAALQGRAIDFDLPGEANFGDRLVPHQLDEASFRPAPALARRAEVPTFRGFERGRRGVGTRNHIVILGTTSRTAAFAHRLAARCRDLPRDDRFDGVVAVTHTEGGGEGRPHNRGLLLRTLAGFITHPNVGAVLAVDYGSEAVPNAEVRRFLQDSGGATDGLQLAWMSIDGAFEQMLDRAEKQVRAWVAPVAAARRVTCGAGDLRLALQCGGSDAFSGVSGNPLAAWVAREVITCSGAANLAETDELIGAEAYILDRVADLDTARRFLHMVERFKERTAMHGASAEGNPSGGNKYRGLYNIVLKSIGAAMKRHPDVPLDGCLEYAEAIPGPGYYFMDSPGNDLESIAGQVASGCNLIYFVTGNGSITNFPFVPTIKLVTTTSRFEALADDMDVNAGAYQDGTPMAELGQELLELTLRIASGQRSRGEAAGHSQVSIWRDWPRTSAAGLDAVLAAPVPDGQPLALTAPVDPVPEARLHGWQGRTGFHLHRIGLVMPTSLCSGQVARLAAERLQARHAGRGRRFCALVHTEGCGVSGGPHEEMFARALIGYLTHPSVTHALLLEHGCEKTHNDYMRARLAEAGIDASRFGYASVQADGGIDRALDVIEGWFAAAAGADAERPAVRDLGGLRLGLLSHGEVGAGVATATARLSAWVVEAGGTVVVPGGDGLLGAEGFVQALGIRVDPAPTLSHGQPGAPAGLHVMEPGHQWTENVSGLGATGVDLLLAHVGAHPMTGHPMLPLVQWTSAQSVAARFGPDLDAWMQGGAGDWAAQLVKLLERVCAGEVTPLSQRGNADFQITRGALGVSL